MQIIFHIDLNALYLEIVEERLFQQPLMRQENMVFIQLCHYFKQNSFAKI